MTAEPAKICHCLVDGILYLHQIIYEIPIIEGFRAAIFEFVQLCRENRTYTHFLSYRFETIFLNIGDAFLYTGCYIGSFCRIYYRILYEVSVLKNE